jgi:hypothetical protein
LPVEQPAGERVVLAHRLVAACGGGDEADLDRAAVELDLLVQGVGIDGAGAAGDRVGDQRLQGNERVGDLGSPTPVNARPRCVGDGLQLT